MLNDRRDGSPRPLQLEDALLPQPATTWHTPSVFRCGAMILALKVALRLYGFGRVIGWIGHRVESVPAAARLDLEAVKAAERAVATAAALYPGRALCLEQSLVLYCLLRRRGVEVKYRHGVIPHPFQAHAWVEYGGEVITDVAEHVTVFARLPDQLP
jgi:hypothetical protein